ncbi:MAG: hypothetical protein J6S85_01975 [Methanobrevibacter sp.]|nr:hypothetical protein [Methanobrevibacter sp.]
MYINNFDTSSSGVNIEFSGRHDTDLSHWEFEDNFEVLKWGRSEAELIFFTDYGQIEAPEKIGDVFKINKHTHKADILDLDWFEGETLAEIKDELLNKPIKDWEDFDSVLDLKAGFEILETKGYCQGDFCKVLINLTGLEKLWGNKPDIKALNEDIDHLFWDCPITANFMIDGVCYDYDLDRYDWQREEFAEQIAKDSGVDVNTLLALMPEHLDYN